MKLKRIFSQNPLFYFGAVSLILFGSMFNSLSLASANNLGDGRVILLNTFFNSPAAITGDSLFSSRSAAIALETPDLKIIQDNTIGGVATPSIVSGKVLGDIFGGDSQKPKEITEYVVQSGDTAQSIADSFNISVNTLLWANELTSASTIRAGQNLTILPTDGVLHAVKSGDTISAIAQNYKSQADSIVAFNNLASQNDIYIGDLLIVPGGVLPKKASPVISIKAPLASNYFIYPAQGYIAQGLHYYNAVDIANKCGTPIYAAAAGVVQRAVGNNQYNKGMGNHITILHPNGTTTYYGHLMTLFVKSGEQVYTGQNIALMGGEPGMPGAGKSTGCHVHFQVMGANNWLASYALNTKIKY